MSAGECCRWQSPGEGLEVHTSPGVHAELGHHSLTSGSAAALNSLATATTHVEHAMSARDHRRAGTGTRSPEEGCAPGQPAFAPGLARACRARRLLENPVALHGQIHRPQRGSPAGWPIAAEVLRGHHRGGPCSWRRPRGGKWARRMSKANSPPLGGEALTIVSNALREAIKVDAGGTPSWWPDPPSPALGEGLEAAEGQRVGHPPAATVELAEDRTGPGTGGLPSNFAQPANFLGKL